MTSLHTFVVKFKVSSSSSEKPICKAFVRDFLLAVCPGSIVI